MASRRALAGAVMSMLLLVPSALAADILLAVETATASRDPFTALPTVEIVLTPEARKAFAKLTLEHIGDVIELRVDGELLTSPVVQTPIMDGVVVISGALTEADANALADRLADQASRITLTPLER
ncbi:SecDF P1 head subdomain-containing protein [Devosia ginsengisoli]|uniref:SecDF P1 head subdomain domain-containing protein n=1 Tax=Devosia ginsengisoli TaxID=400770 RepID=A0A5B8LSZ5_9HYPH|nr:hypothetical protein [Devosia ginsengisoli]QDZ11398.1 hypothetical protein FPZ08_11865 [Devosia ginsengisoli]